MLETITKYAPPLQILPSEVAPSSGSQTEDEEPDVEECPEIPNQDPTEKESEDDEEEQKDDHTNNQPDAEPN